VLFVVVLCLVAVLPHCVAATIGGRKAELAKLESEQDPPLTIKRGWSEFLASSNRPNTGESTLRHEFQWSAFADEHFGSAAAAESTLENASESSMLSM
jgi:hypothetical protein